MASEIRARFTPRAHQLKASVRRHRRVNESEPIKPNPRQSNRTRFRYHHRSMRECSAHRHDPSRVEMDRYEGSVLGSVIDTTRKWVGHPTWNRVYIVWAGRPWPGRCRTPFKSEDNRVSFVHRVSRCEPACEAEVDARCSGKASVRKYKLGIHPDRVEDNFRLSVCSQWRTGDCRQQ
jgi:hypothetical protein